MFGGIHGGWGRERGCGPRGGRDMGGRDGGGWERFERAFGGGRGGPGRGGFGGDDGGGRERGRRMFDGDELRLVLLALIAEEPRHGYDLIREVGERTGGGYSPSPGVVYPSLTMLGELGLIEETAAEGTKRRFAATDEGRRVLAEKTDEVAALMKRLASLGGERERTHGAPVRRAMVNLGMAIRHRLGRGEFSEDTLHDVAALIDELAQKIERLK